MNLSFKKIASAVALATIAAPTLVAAQDNGPLEEIVVTAAKRASTLQDIPIAVTVTSAETIEQAQIQDIGDLQSVVPTLRVSQTQSSANTDFIIRGFGNGGAENPGIEGSVGVFIDGVYRSRSASSISDFPSLERIEVLAGPQSTLFGKNASAGVISIVTKKPTGEGTGKVSATLGNYSAVRLKGYYDGAISDTAAFSVAATHNSSDGYNDNLISGNDVNNRDRQAVRGQLLLNPNDTTEIRIIADYDQIDEECCSATNIIAGPATQAIQSLGGRIVPNDPFSTDTFVNVEPTNEIENAGISLQLDKDFSNFALTSITSFRNTDSFYNIDADFTSLDVIQNAIATEYDTFTQEIRFTSTGGEKLDWMVGGFYFDESIEHFDDLPFGAGFRPFVDVLGQGLVGATEMIIGAPQGTFFREGDGFTHEGTLDNEAISLFSQLDFNITDSLTATVGINYTKDEKEATLTQTRANSFSDLNLAAIASAFFTSQTGLPLTPQTLAAVAQSGPQGLQLATIAGGLISDQARGLQFVPRFPDLPNSAEDNTTDDDEVTYTLRLAWDINDSLNVYGGYSTGFKATSWNLSRDSRPTSAQLPAVVNAGFGVPNLIPGTRFAGPELAKVFELGLKARFERGALNVAVFDQTIEGFQSNAFTGNGFNLTNAGEQSVKGVEFDLTYYPTDALQLKLAGTLLDPNFDEFEGAGRDALTGEVFSLTGTKPGGITETNFSFSANYKFTIGNNDAFIRGDYYYEDETPVGNDLSANPIINIGQFTRETKNLNLAAGLITQNGLGVSLWVRNATDHESIVVAFPGVAQAGTFNAYRTPPRTYGVTVTKDF